MESQGSVVRMVRMENLVQLDLQEREVCLDKMDSQDNLDPPDHVEKEDHKDLLDNVVNKDQGERQDQMAHLVSTSQTKIQYSTNKECSCFPFKPLLYKSSLPTADIYLSLNTIIKKNSHW